MSLQRHDAPPPFVWIRPGYRDRYRGQLTIGGRGDAPPLDFADASLRLLDQTGGLCHLGLVVMSERLLSVDYNHIVFIQPPLYTHSELVKFKPAKLRVGCYTSDVDFGREHIVVSVSDGPAIEHSPTGTKSPFQYHLQPHGKAVLGTIIAIEGDLQAV
jgi:hypothetical protein